MNTKPRGYDLALSLSRIGQGGWYMCAARPTRQMTDRQVGTEQWMYGQMDKWRGKDEVFVRDAETNSCFYPKAAW